MKNIKSKIKGLISQRGVSGVVVAMILVAVGSAGALLLQTQLNTVDTAVTSKVNTALSGM
mgnify:CR=1 FL=1|jgi:Flp pilus assembly pilin Flp